MTELVLNKSELSADAGSTPSGFVVSFRGTADTTIVNELDDFLKHVHTSIRDQRLTQVIVDFRELEFMNSSCFKSFITWLVTVRREPVSNQYSIRFYSARGHHWQKRSLHAFGHFGGELVTIEEF